MVITKLFSCDLKRRLSKEIWWMIPIVHHSIQYIKNCWVRLLSNYNIKYICTIYTRLDTCLMSISRFSLRDKVTHRLLKLCFNIADVVKWSRALDIRLSDWCCSVSMVWVQIRRGKNKHLTAQGSNSNPVWFTNEFYFFAPLNFGNKAITRVVTRQVWDKRSSIFEEIIWLFFSILTDRFTVFVLEAWNFFNVYIQSNLPMWSPLLSSHLSLKVIFSCPVIILTIFCPRLVLLQLWWLLYY
jgi:hypothetical protein